MSPLPRRALLTWLAGAATLAACSRREDPDAATAPTGTPIPPSSAAAPGEAPSQPRTQPPAGLFTVLVIGSDSRNENSFKGLADAIAICQLNAAHDRVNIVSIARDSYVAGAKINASYSRGGPDRLREAASILLGGLPIHATLETTFQRFVTGIEALGGVTVQNVHASDSFGSTFAAGPIHLNGADALNYVRERRGLPLGDFDRTERHRATLTGILDRLHALAGSDPARLGALLPRLYGQVRTTDFSLEQARILLPLLAQLSAASVTSLMVPVSHFASRNGASVVVLDTARTAELADALRAGDLSGYVRRYGTVTAAID